MRLCVCVSVCLTHRHTDKQTHRHTASQTDTNYIIINNKFLLVYLVNQKAWIFFSTNCIVLYEKNAFIFNFGPLGSVPTKKCMKVKVHVFLLWHYARFKIKSESIFLIKYYIFNILKKIGAFRPIFTKVKKLFPILYSNLARKGLGFFSS